MQFVLPDTACSILGYLTSKLKNKTKQKKKKKTISYISRLIFMQNNHNFKFTIFSSFIGFECPHLSIMKEKKEETYTHAQKSG